MKTTPLTRNLLLLTAVNLVLVLVFGLIYIHGTELSVLYNACRGSFGVDSSRYMDRAWETVHSGKPLYPTLLFSQHFKFIYPPSSLLTYSIATALHIVPATFVLALDIVSFAATLLLAGEIALFRLPPRSGSEERLQIRLLIAFLGLLFFPLVYSLQLGQVQTILNFLWTLAVYLWMRDKHATSGLCLALICAFKPTLGVFLLWGLLRRSWRFVVPFVLASLLIQATAIVFFGWRNEVDYLIAISFISHHGEAVSTNQSIGGILQRLTGNAPILTWSDAIYPPYHAVVYYGTLLSSTALLAFGLFAPLLRRTVDRTQDFILFGLLATLASPIVWPHHYGYFFVAYLSILPMLPAVSAKSSYALLASYLVLSNNWPLPAFFARPIWSPLLTLDLYAGLFLIAFLALHLDHSTNSIPARPLSI